VVGCLKSWEDVRAELDEGALLFFSNRREIEVGAIGVIKVRTNGGVFGEIEGSSSAVQREMNTLMRDTIVEEPRLCLFSSPRLVSYLHCCAAQHTQSSEES